MKIYEFDNDEKSAKIVAKCFDNAKIKINNLSENDLRQYLYNIVFSKK